MKKASFTLSVILILLSNTGLIAQHPNSGCEPLDLESVTYIEEENVYDLGFDTDDYLPLDFDPYEYYVNLDAIKYLEEDEAVDYSAYLPHDFNPYAYPTYFRSIDYVDPSDKIDLNFDTVENLPEGFDPFQKVSISENLSL